VNSHKRSIPKEKCFDNTFALVQEGYLFIRNRVVKYQSNLFETRLLGQNVICLSGKKAAKLFYNEVYFKRSGAAPSHVQKTLTGKHAIHTIDDLEHLHRKNMFMSLTTEAHATQLAELFKIELNASISQWTYNGEIILFNEMAQVLCKVVCNWAQVPLNESEMKKRTKDFIAMVDGFGGVGLRYWKGRKARICTERWIKSSIEEVRSGNLEANQDSALYTLAFFKDLDGNLMDAQTAAVDLINLLRPTIAISIFITFIALALHEHSECAQKLLLKEDRSIEMFVQEVRRFYPFAPFVGARVRKNFIYNQVKFKKGTLVLLDLYGTNHDSEIWEHPYQFQPLRFSQEIKDLFYFIPQGGGDCSKTHRCPGEEITIAMMKVALNFLINQIDYDTPNQDLSYSLKRIPSLPKSGFIIRNIRNKATTPMNEEGL
jgi:fatty-acid peroxygenase